MDGGWIELGVFLAGAGSGALLKYMQDRRLLLLYSDLVRRLSGALQQQMTDTVEIDGDAQARLLHAEVEKLRTKSVS